MFWGWLHATSSHLVAAIWGLHPHLIVEFQRKLHTQKVWEDPWLKAFVQLLNLGWLCGWIPPPPPPVSLKKLASDLLALLSWKFLRSCCLCSLILLVSYILLFCCIDVDLDWLDCVITGHTNLKANQATISKKKAYLGNKAGISL